MGVGLAPIVVRRVVSLKGLHGRTFATDANNALHQFLALIRLPDGNPLTDSGGRVTSHLAGLLYRTARLTASYGIGQIFVFDGRPPALKREEIGKRRRLRERSLREMREAQKRGDYASAFSKAVRSGSLTKEMLDDARRLLSLLGIPHFQAPSEAEAQAAHMVQRGDVWAADSRDFDSLLFGAPRLVRYLGISGKEFLPSKGIARPLRPELVEMSTLLHRQGITREQLVDLAILLGTDFNVGLKGIGPKGGLGLIRTHGCLEKLPKDVGSRLPLNYEEIRGIFLKPCVTDEYATRFAEPDRKGVLQFLCGERGFSERRVRTVLARMGEAQERRLQGDLERWMHSGLAPGV